jgi:hypothetical protein
MLRLFGRKIIFEKYSLYFLMFGTTVNDGQQKSFSVCFLDLNSSFLHARLWEFVTVGHWSLLVA